MTDTTFDQHDQTVARQTNVAGDVVHGDKITVIGNHNVVGDHNVVTIIQNLVQGVRRLPTDYATRIQNFLVEYLGTPERPVPFGGRAAALTELDAWLDDLSASPYLLLTAPAGRGKSALLARWSQAVAQREDTLAVIFLPVSVRFRTNLSTVVFASLAARLAHLHGDEVPLTSESAEIWRGMASSYLSRRLPDGRPLLVLLDGVDEAADWDVGADLFPATPPPGLRIVLAARQTAERPTEAAWRRALGWERSALARALDLTPLDRPGVADVLERMGVPLDVLARDVDVTTELHRLSAGDPLLVRLYVDDLWARGEAASRLRPEDLRAIQPGLAGYFDHWWADQRALWGSQTPLKEPTVQALLNLLACALGPLTAEDVLNLAGDCGLNTWTLEEALHALARFIVGDGRGQGYVFQHPKLGDYFYERLTSAERRAWEGRFLDWGKATLEALNAKTLPPREAPAYLVQYYGAHLERAHASDAALYALVSKGWLRAWEALEGTYDGFLGDVARAWMRAEATHDIAMQIKCALCRASVAALSANIPPELLALAVEHGVLTPTQGLVIARQTPDEKQRAKALAGLAPHLPPSLLAEALTAAWVIKYKRGCAEVLKELAPHLSSELLADALKAACAIENEKERAEVLIELASHLSSELLADALKAACAIENEKERAEVLMRLAPHLSSELLSEALTATLAIKNKQQRTEVLIGLAAHLSLTLLSELLIAASTTEDEWLRAKALIGLAPHLPLELLVEAFNAACAIAEEYSRVEVLIGLIPYLPLELLVEAFSAAYAITEEHLRVEVLIALLPYLPLNLITESLDEAFSAARAANELLRAEALTNLAPHLSPVLLAEALTIACTIETEYQRAEALTGLIPYLSSELLTEVLTVSRAIETGEARVRVLSSLAPRLPPEWREQIITEALTITRTIETGDARVRVLSSLAPHLPPEWREQIITEILTATRAIEDVEERTCALSGLAPHLPPELLAESLIIARTAKWWCARSLTRLSPYLPLDLLTEALGTALAIENEGARAAALIGLAPYLSPDLLSKALSAAYELPESLVVNSCRAKVLTGLAPHLPPDLLTETLSAVRAIENEWERAEALTGLAPYLQFDLLAEALTIVHAIKHDHPRVKALSGLAPYLPPELIPEALTVARTIWNDEDRTNALISLAPHLPPELREQVLFEMLTTARAIRNETMRAEKLTQLIPYLPLEQRAQVITEVLTAVRPIEYRDSGRVRILIELFPHLSPEQRAQVLTEALTVARVSNGGFRVLSGLAPHLPPELIAEVLTVARTIWDDRDRANALIGLAPHLPPELREQVLFEMLTTARAIRNEAMRAEKLTRLIPYLPLEKRAQVIAEALNAASTTRMRYFKRLTIPSRLTSHLVIWAQQQLSQAYSSACPALRELAAWPRPEFLRDLEALTPFFMALVPEDSRPQVAADIFHAIQDVCTWWP